MAIYPHRPNPPPPQVIEAVHDPQFDLVVAPVPGEAALDPLLRTGLRNAQTTVVDAALPVSAVRSTGLGQVAKPTLHEVSATIASGAA